MPRWMSLDVAGLEGVALPGKGQCGFAVQMVPALGKGGGVVVAGAAHGGKGLVGVHIHAADGVDDADEACKVDADVVVHIHAVEVAQCGHAGLHAVQAGMGQLILAVGARQINIIIAGGVDEGRLLGGGVDHGKDVHIAAGLFRQLTAVVHAGKVHHKGLLGDLVGLHAGEDAGGDAAQSGQTLLGPDAAQRQRPAEQDREHAGDDARRAVLLAPLDQQPEQRQQRCDEDEIERGQHLGAPELHQRSHAQNGLKYQQDHPSFREFFVREGHCVLPGRGGLGFVVGRVLFGGLGRRRGGLRRLRREKRRAVHLDGLVIVVPCAPVDVPGGIVRAGTVVFVKHRKSHSFWWVSLTTREQWSARRGPADRWPTGLPPGASRSARRCGPGRGNPQSGPPRPAPGCGR